MLIFRRCIGSLINEEKITTLNNDTVRVRLEALKNENGEIFIVSVTIGMKLD